MGFTIERCTGANCTNFAPIDGVGANITAYSDPTVAGSTTYSYRVVAFNGVGNSGPSNVATVTTPAPPVVGPATPTNLTATQLFNPTRVQVSWRDNSNNENQFRVWRSTNGGAFSQVGTVTRTTTQRTATGGTVNFTDSNNLVNGNTYAYYVIAVNTVPNPDQFSAASNTASVTIALPAGPAAPTNLTGSAVRPPGANLDVATLNWTDNANNEAGFQIQRSTSPNFTTVSTFTVGADVTTFSQNVSRTNDYYYRVRAGNASGYSAWSNVVFVTTP
jgi:titin